MAKILKWLTGSKAKSYDIKFALEDINPGSSKNISESELGAALQEVIHCRFIRGKFNSVHPDLRAKGVTRVEVGSQGITFHRDSSVGEFISTGFFKTAYAYEGGPCDNGEQTGTKCIVASNKRLGNEAFKAKDFKRAVAAYEKAVNLDPETMACWGNLSAILMETKAFKEVRQECQRCKA